LAGLGVKCRVLLMVNGVSGGGVERVAYAHGRALAFDPGFELAMAVCGGCPDYLPADRCFTLPDFREAAKIRGVIGVGFNRGGMERLLMGFRPDIIHIHAYIQFSPGALSAVLAYKMKNRCKIFMTHHTFAYICPNDALYNFRAGVVCEKCVGKSGAGIIWNNCYGNAFGSWGKYVQKANFRRIFDRGLVDAHIAPSVFVRDKLKRHDPKLDAAVVQNPSLGSVLPEMPRKTLGKAVFFGRLSREKNVLAAAEAALGMPGGMRLMIVGGGPEAGRLKGFLKEHGSASDKIDFIDEFMPKDKLYRAVSDAEYFVLPSVCYETAGVSLIEALNLGMTPVVSGHGSLREIVESANVGYLFDPHDAESISKALESAAANRKNDEKALAGAVRGFLNGHTEKAYAAKILALYGRGDCT